MRMKLSLRQSQRGIALLEALIAILVFSLGVLGIVSLQASSARAVAEASVRADAAMLANQVIGMMWADATANIGSYAYLSGTSTGSLCEAPFAAGAAAASTPTGNLATWLGSSSEPGSVLGTLPGGQARIQIIGAGSTNIATVTVCWQSADPQSASGFTMHNYETVSQIQR
ncbi:type IV pilus modification protein PilV [Nitrogeniibacter aestuarii]|uniref:type IV pilus modification protein PilV n=1 Tax=Nitrogeniibacter aestuarii TaxID=2815343 RepID=UPI001D11E94D|nr:type IV pilus modification protein PilV [Nitrogeniibacter aestuarii]